MVDETIPTSQDFGDWDEEKASEDVSVPAGEHEFTVDQWKFEYSRQKEVPQISFFLRTIAEGALWHNTTFGSWFFRNAIIHLGAAAGLSPQSFDLAEIMEGPGSGNTSTEWLDSLVGAVATGKVVEETYEETTRAKLKKFV